MSTTVVVGLRALPDRDPDLPLPAYASAGAAGLDICANLPVDERIGGIEIAPGGRLLVPTGLAMAIPDGYEMQLRPRSGLALREGLTLLNAPGTVDSDYRGEVAVLVINHGSRPVLIEHGMRIAQGLLAPVVRAAFEMRDDLGDTARGAGGFGSTGHAARPGAREGEC